MMSARKLLHTLRDLITKRDGASAVELAICLPLIAAIIVPLTDLGMGAYTQMQVANAAQAGAEYAAAKGWNSDNIVTMVANATNLAGIQPNPSQKPAYSPAPAQSCSCVSGTTITAATPASAPPCSQTCPSGSVGTFVTVTAQASYTPLFSYPFISSPVTLTAQSVIRIK